MLRQFLLYLSTAAWARNIVTQLWLARRVARRFVAGETLDEAISVAKQLNAQGLLVTLDYLGESVAQAKDTEAVRDMYINLAKQIQQHNLQASISLKLTHLGLDISEDLCITNLRHIMQAAQSIPVTLDMESSNYIDTTLRIYRTLRDEYNYPTIGTVIQSMIRRSADDMQQLAAEGARIRLVKGAYREAPEVAYPDKADVDRQYVTIVHNYLSHCPPAYLEVATHDESIITDTLNIADKSAHGYEFQMLYGIRQPRQLELAQMGHKIRVYVPFGEAWYPYFMRRLAERPANLWFFVRSIFRA